MSSKVYDVRSSGNSVYVTDVTDGYAIMGFIGIIIVMSVVTFFISNLYSIAVGLAVILMIVGVIGLIITAVAYSNDKEKAIVSAKGKITEEDLKGSNFILLFGGGISAVVIVFGLIILLVANAIHATQKPKVEMRKDTSGLFSNDSHISMTSGKYTITPEIKNPRVCITNERGFGPDTGISVKLDGKDLTRIDSSNDDEACWSIKSQDKSYLEAGEHTLVVENNAGKVEKKIVSEGDYEATN